MNEAQHFPKAFQDFVYSTSFDLPNLSQHRFRVLRPQWSRDCYVTFIFYGDLKILVKSQLRGGRWHSEIVRLTKGATFC